MNKWQMFSLAHVQQPFLLCRSLSLHLYSIRVTAISNSLSTSVAGAPYKLMVATDHLPEWKGVHHVRCHVVAHET